MTIVVIVIVIIVVIVVVMVILDNTRFPGLARRAVDVPAPVEGDAREALLVAQVREVVRPGI